jgi:predicted nucleic acid-binding protein
MDLGVDYLIDTSAYSALNRGDERFKKFFAPDSQLIFPMVVVGELRAGFVRGNRQQENEILLQKVLDHPGVHTVTISEATTRRYAHIYKHLREKGTSINTNDMWIAALALEHNCLLVTLDSDFSHVPDLLVAKI